MDYLTVREERTGDFPKICNKIDRDMPYTLKNILPYVGDVCRNPYMYECATFNFEHSLTLREFIEMKRRYPHFCYDLTNALFHVYAFL